mmetsp:Transcript_22828/g.60802  ORF Transcript_22828/g.60802 Transcript_22828/m.60802 type:complete len:223 (+) Transcript_22828:775-1443(+)
MATSSSWNCSSLVAMRLLFMPIGCLRIRIPPPPGRAGPCSIVPIFFCKIPRHFLEPFAPLAPEPAPPPSAPLMPPPTEARTPRLSCTARVAAPASEAKLMLLTLPRESPAAMEIEALTFELRPLLLELRRSLMVSAARSWMIPVIRREEEPCLPVGAALKCCRFHSMQDVSRTQPSCRDWYGIAECMPPKTKTSSAVVLTAECSVLAGGTCDAASSSIGDHS